VNFLTSRTLLRIGPAVAALLVLEDGRYIMQLRDDVPDIWYPGHWGLFGGGVDTGEDDIAALRRELWEELELDLGEARPFVVLNYDLQPVGLNCYFRRYFEVAVSTAAWKRAVLLREVTYAHCQARRHYRYHGYRRMMHLPCFSTTIVPGWQVQFMRLHSQHDLIASFS
jgi:8-oxo-dGTP pyrophosphatase MutT (NUDIX family)